MGASYKTAASTAFRIEELGSVLAEIIEERQVVDGIDGGDCIYTERITKLEGDFGRAIAELRKTVDTLENQMRRAWEF
jgi:hypothetical protein